MKLSILIPVYNERALIAPFWERLQAAPISRCPGIDAIEILIVDDGSTDGTAAALEEVCRPPKFGPGIHCSVQLLRHERNRGKGAAIRTAIAQSTGDIVLIQDADLEYSPQDYPAMLAPLSSGVADAVFGSRFIGWPRRILYFWHSLCNRLITLLSNMLLDVNLTDMETGYKALRGPLARSLRLTSNRFGLEPELTARLVQRRARLYEVPVSYFGRTYAEGKKIGMRDAFAAVWHILRFSLWDRDPYLPGLSQTLHALDGEARQIYWPALHRALRRASLSPESRILEVGAGIGSITRFLVGSGTVVATDVDAEMVGELRKRFPESTKVDSRVWDAGTPWKGAERFEMLVAFNVLEHLEHDVDALTEWNRMLAPEGRLALLVPQYPALFTPLDRSLGHHRRYRRAELHEKLARAGFTVEETYQVNPLGILGWYAHGKLLGRDVLPAGQLRLYSALKRFLFFVEAPLAKLCGLSLVVVARRSKRDVRPERAVVARERARRRAA